MLYCGMLWCILFFFSHLKHQIIGIERVVGFDYDASAYFFIQCFESLVVNAVFFYPYLLPASLMVGHDIASHYSTNEVRIVMRENKIKFLFQCLGFRR